MQWSKLKTRAKAFIVASLRKRIDFHLTSYRRSHDEAEKAWVTVDGKQVFTASWYQHQWARADISIGRYHKAAKSVTEPEQLEFHRPQQFGEALRLYLDMPVAEALESEDPFIKAMAMIDRRVGRNRLETYKPRSGDHSLVRLFYELRVQSNE